MSSDGTSQALCGPFLSDDLPTFQAAIEHLESQFRGVLPETACRIVYAYISLTTKFGKRWRRISPRLLVRGLPRNPNTGFAGLAAIDVSERTLWAHYSLLERLGVLVRDGKGRAAIDYSKTAADLIEDEEIRKSVRKANAHNPRMRTDEGVIAWAIRKAEWLLRVATKPEQPKPLKNNDCSYSFIQGTEKLSKDKSSESTHARNWLMRTKDAVLKAITAQVDAQRSALQSKREKRATIADLCALFEDGWRNGQRERDSTYLPARLIPRDRSLLKTQIVVPGREVGLDVKEFAHWVSANWDAIGAQYFKKTKAYPQAPAFRWFIACLETYTLAFQNRDYLDTTGKLPDYRRVSAEAVAATKSEAKAALSAAERQIADLKAQLKEQESENKKLRAKRGMAADDDPIFAKAIKLGQRKITIGSYDDEPEPRKRKIRK